MHRFCSLPPSKHCKHRPIGGVAPSPAGVLPTLPRTYTCRNSPGGGGLADERLWHACTHEACITPLQEALYASGYWDAGSESSCVVAFPGSFEPPLS
jgi:hypothetical protein